MLRGCGLRCLCCELEFGIEFTLVLIICVEPLCTYHFTLYFLFLVPPKVFLYNVKSEVETKLSLVCVANGFYPDVITMRIKKRGQILTEKEGLQSTGVFKNNNEAFEIKNEVQVLKSDLSMYSCEVIHSAKKIIKFWGKKLLFCFCHLSKVRFTDSLEDSLCHYFSDHTKKYLVHSCLNPALAFNVFRI